MRVAGFKYEICQIGLQLCKYKVDIYIGVDRQISKGTHDAINTECFLLDPG